MINVLECESDERRNLENKKSIFIRSFNFECKWFGIVLYYLVFSCLSRPFGHCAHNCVRFWELFESMNMIVYSTHIVQSFNLTTGYKSLLISSISNFFHLDGRTKRNNALSCPWCEKEREISHGIPEILLQPTLL